MRIDKVNVYKVVLPFKGDFSISRLKGLSSNHVVMEVVADQGEIRGYGDAVPVEFVTGETPESAIKSAKSLLQSDFFPWDLSDVSRIWDFVDSIPDGMEHNAALCAIEMALLDALGKGQGKPVIDYFPKDFYINRVYYGASVTLGSKERILEICRLIKGLGINHLRIKMDNDFEQNRYATKTVRSILGEECELRIDPNGVWDRDLAFRHLPLIKDYRVKVVEEPMMREAPGFVEFAGAVRSEGAILMACESAPTLNHVKKIIKEGYFQSVNVKLSRSGGFRRALGIIEHVRKEGFSFQIGCTVGESGLLSAAGRALCLLCSDAVTYDGSYDEFILKENITNENVSFGPGGEAGPLDGPGLGVEVSIRNLERLSDASSRRITIERSEVPKVSYAQRRRLRRVK